MLRRITAVVVAAGLALGAGAARADRTPSAKTVAPPSTGTRVDITVPYLTSGNSTLMSGGVAPRIYGSPTVENPKYPQVKPVFNLIFYGSAQSFGDRSNGAEQRPPNMLRPPRP
jgi:hypothetical protein